jgi:hypothetical protein
MVGSAAPMRCDHFSDYTLLGWDVDGPWIDGWGASVDRSQKFP